MKPIKNIIPQKIKNTFKHLPLAVLANLAFAAPGRRMELVGITGTDGKTTVTFLIHHLLNSSGRPAGLVSTVTAKIGDKEIATGFHVTSPNPWKLQQLLKKMKRAKLPLAVLEVTSHGLDQHRFWGCRFKVGVLTNITNEALDYHGNFKNYVQAKGKLFAASTTSILNRDDPSFETLKKMAKKTVVTYGLKNKADFRARSIRLGRKETLFKVEEKGKLVQEIRSPLLGKFNVYNQLAAIAACRSLGVSHQAIAQAIRTFPGIIGRMEFIKNKKGFRVIIDFAHTTNGIEKTLGYLKTILPRGGRLIAVFGAAGERDFEKRGPMGQEAAKASNVLVLTAEDPRSEDPKKIITAIARGSLKGGMKRSSLRKSAEVKAKKKNKVYFVVPNRQEAINFAIRKLAQPRDIVVLLGKGHERSMCFGTTEYPWSEHQAVKIALKERG